MKILKIKNEDSLIYSSGEIASLKCARCFNPLCMFYTESEIDNTNKIIKNFPTDKNYNCCPTNAISINNETHQVEIDQNKCLSCGVCASRCPFGCIYFNGKCFAVQTNYKGPSNPKKVKDEKEAKLIFRQSKKRGCLVLESDHLFDSIYEKIKKLTFEQQNLLCRNLLLSLDYQCFLRRVGDVYTRMDAFYIYKQIYGPSEFEFKNDSLEASRGILDDIAVLNCRFGLKKEEVTPLVILLSLSNKRQGFWQVSKDIKNVLGIKIRTITIGALMLLVWNFKDLDLSFDNFYLDFDESSIRELIEKAIERKIEITCNHKGILEPMK